MPGQLEITARILVRAAPGQVWRAVVDWPRQHEWVLGTRVHGGHGAGAEVVARTGVGPIGFTDTMVITEWDPPRRCVVRHTGRVVRGTGVFEVAPRGLDSEFSWTEQIELPRIVPGSVARAIIRPLASWGLAVSLRRFASHVASTSAAG